MNLRTEIVRKRIDAAHADAVQTTGDLIAVL